MFPPVLSPGEAILAGHQIKSESNVVGRQDERVKSQMSNVVGTVGKRVKNRMSNVLIGRIVKRGERTQADQESWRLGLLL